MASGRLVDRSMYWNPGGVRWGGGHNTIALNDKDVRWYIPEGATHVGDYFVHVVNPSPQTQADVLVTFMNMAAETWTTQTRIKPEANWTIYVNEIVGSQSGISTTIESRNNEPVAADHTIYWDSWHAHDPSPYIKWIDGTSSCGTAESATKWYIAEGATHICDHYICIQNASMTQAAQIKVTFMDYSGKITKHYHTVLPHSRYTIFTNYLLGKVPGFSAEIESTNGVPIFCERATYWSAGGYKWAGGTASIGAIYAAPLWFLPEGATDIFDEYITIANPNAQTEAVVDITFYDENGVATSTTRTVKAHSRFTLRVNDVIQAPAISTKVLETKGRIPIITERIMYWDPPPPDGVHWGGGHGTIGIGVRQPFTP